MTAADAIGSSIRGGEMRLPRLLRIAARDLRAGLSGFRIFIACVALGVMVITGVGGVSNALRGGFEKQGEAILGGDATLSRMHERAVGEERETIETLGRVSESATMRTMARRPDGADQTVAELKLVDATYPLVGDVLLTDGTSARDALQKGALVDPTLLERLNLKTGDMIGIGSLQVPVAGALKEEPDGIADRITYGPRILVSQTVLNADELIKPGTLVRWRYALKLGDASADEAELAVLRERVAKALPEAGFTVADRRDPSPQITRTLERLRQFLTLIGLTALLIGGVGIANAVATFIDKRRKVIATMKSIGATSRMVMGIFLAEVMAVAGVGVVIGVALGAVTPPLLNWLLGGLLPIEADPSLTALGIGPAIVYGFGVALLFTLWPLGRVERVTASMLFRDEVAAERTLPRPWVIAATVGIGLALLAFALLTSDSKRIALSFVVGVIAVFAVFYVLGTAVTWLARRMRRPRYPELALAIGNIGAPGGLARSVVLSLGAGLSLLVAVALADASLVRELEDRLPTRSPDYFLLDVAKDDFGALKDIVHKQVPSADLAEAPMLRGRLVRLNETPVEEISAPPEAQWVLTGDRGLSYSETVPPGSRIVAGEWWPENYEGEPLVSFEADLAGKLGLKVGDTVTVNVLGRNLTARVANLREVKWETLAINFVMIFTPNTLAAAPHNLLVTISMPPGTPVADDAQAMRDLGKAMPSVTAIRVRDVLNTVGEVFEKVMTAVRAAGSVTLLAGALVLAGALATAQRRRILEAVILKTLGATRRRILTSHFLEYSILAGVTALFALALGTIGAAVVVTQLMNISFTFSLSAVALALGLAMGLVFLFGGVGTWAVLRAPAVPYLRSE